MQTKGAGAKPLLIHKSGNNSDTIRKGSGAKPSDPQHSRRPYPNSSLSSLHYHTGNQIDSYTAGQRQPCHIVSLSRECKTNTITVGDTGPITWRLLIARRYEIRIQPIYHTLRYAQLCGSASISWIGARYICTPKNNRFPFGLLSNASRLPLEVLFNAPFRTLATHASSKLNWWPLPAA